MKRILLTAMIALFSSTFCWAQLIITGVFDGPLSGGTPKAIELYATADIADLSLYGLGCANNGGGTDGIETTFPAIGVKAGTFLYVASEVNNFTAYFGFPPHFTGAAAFVNGDDAIELFRNGVVIDIFGDINVDGTGEAWDYLDGWVYRVDGTGPDGSMFQLANFTYSGINVNDGQTSNGTAVTPFPIGSYSSILVDGMWDPIYGNPLCVQDNETGFGDNSNPAFDAANGSELDAAYVRIDGNKLFLLITGNLETNFNKLEIFIDAAPGGQNQLPGNNPDVDFNGLNRMGDDGSGNGLIFDAAFTSDFFFTASGGNSPYELYANFAPTDGSGGTGTFLGGGAGSVHSLSNGGMIAIDNSNIAGVTGTSIGNPAAVMTGIEWSIPLSEIGNPSGIIRISAFVNGSGHDFLSNQVLCGIGGGMANLGEPRNVNFGNIAGDQFFSLCTGVDGGIVLTETGQGTVFICPGDSIPNVVHFDSITSSTVNYGYVVTDPNGVILGLPGADSLDFEGAGFGECWVWGLAYTGSVTAMVGDTATLIALSDSCFDLSDNFIRVVRDTAEGGMVMTAMGQDTITLCLGSGMEVINFDSMGTSTADYAYVVTDPMGVILGLTDTDSVDFSGAGPGVCWVWGLSFTGNLTAQLGDNALSIALSDDCFDLSSNYVVVIREETNGGMVTTAMGADTVYYCIGGVGGSSGMYNIDSTGTLGSNFTYVVTDNQGNILGVPPADMVDVTGAGVGECWVWGLSYEDTLLAQLGDNATMVQLASGCYDLSDNYVVIFRDTIAGGMVMTESGQDTVAYCVGSSGGTSGVYALDSMNVAGPNFTYVVTDNNGVILGVPGGDVVDVTGAGPGECWVWGLSYSGSITAAPGDTASAIALTDGCWELSSNYVVIFRSDSLSGGNITTEMGEDTVFYCVGASGGSSGIYDLDSANVVGTNFAYVVTDNSGVILGLPGSDRVDVTGAGLGECWVWGLSYTGNVLAQVGDNATMVDLTDACWDLSDTYLVIFRDSLSGGTVVTTNDQDTVRLCLTDLGPDVVDFNSLDATGGTFSYVVTDTATEILGVPSGNSVDFGGAGAGECWVWGLSFTGELLLGLGDTVAGNAISSGCYSLSSNYVVVFRDTVGGACLTNLEDELSFREVTLFPNPAQGSVQLRFTSTLPNATLSELTVFNLLGQPLRKQSFATMVSGQNEFTLSLEGISQGLYLLEFQNGDRKISRRLRVE